MLKSASHPWILGVASQVRLISKVIFVIVNFLIVGLFVCILNGESLCSFCFNGETHVISTYM